MAHLKIPKPSKKVSPQAYLSNYTTQAGVLIPKRVICALYDYRSEAPYQLSFRAGDYFHVIGNENDEHWWEATNPMTKVRGMVPASYFEIVEKKKNGGTHDYNSSNKRNNAGTQPAFLGRVLYDFESQSPEELSAVAGEHIIIVGQSNPGWLIAKPIGKLGGLGLVPSSYVEIKDARTGQPIRAGDVRTRANGVNIDTSMVPRSSDPSSEALSPREQAIRAGVSTYFLQNDCYYFEVQISLLDGHNRVLYKLYEDFYDFHVSLLKTYPREAGSAGQYRIIPFMPGPVNFVDEAITIRRCHELNIYVKQLFGLPKYIQESKIVREFFGLEEPGEDEANVARKRVISNRRPSHDDAEIKIQYRDDLIAIRVSSGITLNALRSKISERLGKSSVTLSYRSRNNDPVRLNSQQDLHDAWSQGKLYIYAS
ncbi:Phox-like protein [Basidiobolus meristosporus CBS 931.73]|uniref:Phox-like protein n=1 Tax=Basidiobolus meristosporus CBS 931.73 TaxID=1314790 RepID=A0A1Y1ZD13_9FUNG|nr:Phox-like protein [Basidiobolus meristosporus CBS 931.73]|eukprot:ORY07857.1 Phox-like protein [Basidiobolus meristosporus CBS 931.73]